MLFVQFILYPLDIYNDVAQRAISVLNRRFLFDEIEAEVNLCFDQLIYKLSDQVYSFFKVQAASSYLENSLKSNLELKTTGRLNAGKTRYPVLLQLRHMQLLGRSIDLNHLLGQRMNSLLRKNIVNAIGRFESQDIAHIIVRVPHSSCVRKEKLDSLIARCICINNAGARDAIERVA